MGSEFYRSRNTCCHRVVCSNPIGFENYWKYTYGRWFILFTYLHTQWQISSGWCIAPPKMSDNACSLHCYDTTYNNVKVHWHYTLPKCARPGRISGTLCLNAPFARVCENSYFYEMAHVIIKCRVTFGKEMFNDCIKPHSICMRLVLSTQEEFSLKRAHYGHSPLNVRSTEVTDLRLPRWPNRLCANSSLAMSWPNHVQILSFASMAPSQVARKHDFVAKNAGGCSSYDVIAPWPDLIRSIFSLPKIAQGLPHQVAQNPAARTRKTSGRGGGLHQPPCTGEA